MDIVVAADVSIAKMLSYTTSCGSYFGVRIAGALFASVNGMSPQRSVTSWVSRARITLAGPAMFTLVADCCRI